MDESLKARLIGASVLVVIAVIFVPEVLSGRRAGPGAGAPPGERGTRSFTIDLAGGNNAAPAVVETPAPSSTPTPPVVTPPPAAAIAETQPAVHAAPESRAGDAVDATPAPTASTAPVTAPAASAPTPTPAASPARAPATPVASVPQNVPPPGKSGGAWAVQVGAFGSTQASDKVVQELRAAGFHAYVSPVQRSGKTLFRVRVGPESERARADAVAATLKGRNLPATVVAND